MRSSLLLERTNLHLASDSPNATGHDILPNTFELKQTPQLECLITTLRDVTTSKTDFIFYADRVMRLLIEEGLNCLPVKPKIINTPLQKGYQGQSFEGKLCGVSILRAGEAMETSLRSCARGAKLGKILIQRNPKTFEAELYFAKLPSDVADRHCLLLDPMLATGASAIKALDVLREHGVPEEHIIFINILSCPEGLGRIAKHAPKATIITGKVDTCLNPERYIVPGLGDFGDLYF